MARTDTLANYLTDVAAAIKTKKGDNTPIKASEFDIEIANLPTGSSVKYNLGFNEDFEAEALSGNSVVDNITKIAPSDTSKRKNWNHYFASLSGLTEIPDIDTSSLETCNGMYLGCSSITKLPDINLSRVTELKDFCFGCDNLLQFPEIDTQNITSLYRALHGCISLVSVPNLNASNLANVYMTFYNCTALTDFGGFKDLGKAFLTTNAENYSSYKLDLSKSTLLTEQSLINVLNGLYNIASIGVKAQQCVLGSTNLAKLTSSEGKQALSGAQARGWTVS